MLRKRSDDTQTAFRTEPPLTDEVLECAIKNYLGESYRDQLFNENGALVVARVGIPEEQIKIWNDSLTNAEELVHKQKTTAETSREDALQARAKMMGLPLE